MWEFYIINILIKCEYKFNRINTIWKYNIIDIFIKVIRYNDSM